MICLLSSCSSHNLIKVCFIQLWVISISYYFKNDLTVLSTIHKYVVFELVFPLNSSPICMELVVCGKANVTICFLDSLKIGLNGRMFLSLAFWTGNDRGLLCRVAKWVAQCLFYTIIIRILFITVF